MPDQHIVSDNQRRAIGIARPGGVAMQHAAVLHVGPLADHDPADIGSQHTIVPDGTVRPDLDIADNRAPRRDKDAVVDVGRLSVDRNDVHAWSGGHCEFSHCSLLSEY